MKKVLTFVFILLGLFSLCLISVNAEGEEEPVTDPVVVDPVEPDPVEPDPVEPEPEVIIGKVVIGECLYGAATVSPEEGQVGDIITIYPSAQVFCSLKAVKVNGTIITKNDKGEYQFVLAEGENIVTVECEVSQEDMKVLADLINNAKKGNWEEIFSINNIFNIVSWAISLFMGSGFLIALLRNKKIKALTASDISSKMESVVPETVAKVVMDTFQPILDKVNNAIKDVNLSCDSLVRCMMLMQENTPESRIAITKELGALGRSTTDIEKQVRSIIDEEIAKLETAKEEKKQALASLEQKNNEVVEKFTTNQETIDEDLKGRI